MKKIIISKAKQISTPPFLFLILTAYIRYKESSGRSSDEFSSYYVKCVSLYLILSDVMFVAARDFLLKWFLFYVILL